MTSRRIYVEPRPLLQECKSGTSSSRAKDVDINADEKWTTLKHNGLFFPFPYKPQNLYVYYDGKKIDLPSNTNNKFNIGAEEAAVFFAQAIDLDNRKAENKLRHKNTEDKVYRKNFWDDWKVILENSGIKSIKDFDKVDFGPIVRYIEKKAEKKKKYKEMTEEEKAEHDHRKKIRQEMKEIYGYAIMDDYYIPIAYSVEPPGLFMGHGNQPNRGKIKKRLSPRDVTINVSFTNIPKCYIRDENGKIVREEKWADVVEKKNASWLASWKHPISGKNVQTRANRNKSHLVCAADRAKFDKASTLDKNIENIRKQYRKDMISDNAATRELAVAVYLLDLLAIRPGTEKDEKTEANTVGLTTLKCENIEFRKNNVIELNFLGKSSIAYEKKVKIIPEAYKILENNCEYEEDLLFPRLNSTSLNAYLKNLIDGVTAKVFRTWKASSIMQAELDKAKPNIYLSIPEKVEMYNKANLDVALALNHKLMLKDDKKIAKLKDTLRELSEQKSTAATEKKRIATQTKLEQAEKNVALTTSKINYIDPRISVAWAKRYQVPIEKIFNPTQRDKFVWAMSIDSTWKF